VIAGRDTWRKADDRIIPGTIRPFDHLKLVLSSKGLGRLQEKDTSEFCLIDWCNSFGLCSSNADRISLYVHCSGQDGIGLRSLPHYDYRLERGYVICNGRAAVGMGKQDK
jgi:hypothetical protein